MVVVLPADDAGVAFEWARWMRRTWKRTETRMMAMFVLLLLSYGCGAGCDDDDDDVGGLDDW